MHPWNLKEVAGTGGVNLLTTTPAKYGTDHTGACASAPLTNLKRRILSLLIDTYFPLGGPSVRCAESVPVNMFRTEDDTALLDVNGHGRIRRRLGDAEVVINVGGSLPRERDCRAKAGMVMRVPRGRPVVEGLP